MIASVTNVGLTGFPSPTTVPVTKLELILSTLVCGRHWYTTIPSMATWTSWAPAPTSVHAFSIAERLELAGISIMIAAYVDEDGAGSLFGTQYYHDLESTEMGQASARLGAGIAGLLAEHFLGVPALHHVSAMPAAALAFATGQRPDYVGRDKDEQWVVVEAKGRTLDTVGPAAITRWKNQAAVITSIMGSTPVCCAASIALLRTGPLPIHAHFEDPAPTDDGVALDEIDVLRLGP